MSDSEKKIENINRIWSRLVVSTILTTLLYFILSYDLFSAYDIFLFIFFIVCVIETISFFIKAIKICIYSKIFPSKWLLITFLFFSISIPLNYCYRNGLFWGKKVIEAAFLDDRSRMDLTLFENGHFLINSSWLFGDETFTGKYLLHGDTIEFTKYPVIINDLIEKKIVRKNNRIYFRKDNVGNYDTTFYYFQIDFNKQQ